MHKGFGDDTSKIKHLTNDTWTQQESLYLTFGGNENFTKFLENYPLLLDESSDVRLHSEAAAYYRRFLHARVTNDQEFKEEAPNVKVGQGPKLSKSDAMMMKGKEYVGAKASAVKSKADESGLTEKAVAAGAAAKEGAIKAGAAAKEGAQKAGAFMGEKAEEY